MKLVTLKHKGILYEFRLLARAKVVEISKENEFHYFITFRNGYANCSCPGSRYHHKCWHPSALPALLNQPEIKEPWTEWAEEAGVMEYITKRKEVK